MNKHYTVIGQPIAHSMSPTIHSMFGELTDRNILYTRTESTPDTFSKTIDDLQQAGMCGCNVTLPFKEQAAVQCHELNKSAKDAQAVNTIHFHADGIRYGHNTDGSGLLADLKNNLKYVVEGKRILLIGAGGAARGALGPLADESPSSITIANRTLQKAQQLAKAFTNAKASITASEYNAIQPDDQFDLVINATSLSLQNQLPPLPDAIFANQALSYDMMYGSNDTIFMHWSQQNGAEQVSDGLGMLIEQAADAFEIWEGIRPETKSVYDFIKAQLA